MLSLKDLSLIRHINELSDAGVDCIKIEGRMKDADYVGLVTETYRKAIDNKEVTESDIQKLESVFYRGGYTDEYLTGKKSQDMYAVKRDENPYLRQVKYEKPPEKKPLYDIKRREKVVINIEKFNYKNRKKLYISAQIRNIKQYNAVSETEISRIYVPADLIVKHSDIMDFSRVVCVLPRIGFDKALVEKVKSLGAEKACATNLGQILPLIDMGFDIIGDYSLNVFNSLFISGKGMGIRK